MADVAERRPVVQAHHHRVPIADRVLAGGLDGGHRLGGERQLTRGLASVAGAAESDDAILPWPRTCATPPPRAERRRRT
jgi:hypothetical protein